MIVGIDPGLTGAVAALDADGLIVEDMPTVEIHKGGKLRREVSPALFAHLLRFAFDFTVDLCVIEDVSAMPNQGATSGFGFGRSKGVVEGAVAMMGWPTELVRPNIWKKQMALTKSKDGARAKALELWPAQAERFARVKDDGRAEAALLAEWGRRLLAERGAA